MESEGKTISWLNIGRMTYERAVPFDEHETPLKWQIRSQEDEAVEQRLDVPALVRYRLTCAAAQSIYQRIDVLCRMA